MNAQNKKNIEIVLTFRFVHPVTGVWHHDNSWDLLSSKRHGLEDFLKEDFACGKNEELYLEVVEANHKCEHDGKLYNYVHHNDKFSSTNSNRYKQEIKRLFKHI